MNIFIFGGTGDLAGRKLLPALYRHFKANRLSTHTKILSIGSRAIDTNEYRKFVKENLQLYLNAKEFEESICNSFLENILFLQIDFNKPESFQSMSSYARDGKRNIYYLAVSPIFYKPIVDNLSKQKLIFASSSINLHTVISPASLPYRSFAS